MDGLFGAGRGHRTEFSRSSASWPGGSKSDQSTRHASPFANRAFFDCALINRATVGRSGRRGRDSEWEGRRDTPRVMPWKSNRHARPPQSAMRAPWSGMSRLENDLLHMVSECHRSHWRGRWESLRTGLWPVKCDPCAIQRQATGKTHSRRIPGPTSADGRVLLRTPNQSALPCDQCKP